MCRARDQARRALLLAAVVALPACTERISELDPRPGLSNLFFRTHLEGREPPPGLDGDFPNLASVPPRPEPPSAETRQSLSAALAADRERSRTPQGLVGSPGLAAGAGPPAPPRLAAAPPIRLEPGALPAPAPAALPIPARPAAPQAPEQAAVPPALPPAAAPRAPEPSAAPPPAPAPELLAPAPPPPPSRELLAPPPPPSRDLLAPRGG